MLMQEAIQIGFMSLLEFLNRSGFTDGFLHGAYRKTINEVMDSETMQNLIDMILIRTGEIRREDVKAVLKFIFETPILIERKNMIGENVGEGTLTIMGTVTARNIIDKAIERIAYKDPNEREFLAKIIAKCLEDQVTYGKPLYSAGEKIGEATTNLLKNTSRETYTTIFHQNQIRQRNISQNVSLNIQAPNSHNEDEYIENSRCPCFRSCTVL